MNDTTLPHFRRQSSLLTEYKKLLRVNANAPRWTDEEIYLGINEGLRQWSDNVAVPYWYTLSDGFAAGTYEYALPNYIRPPLRVQVRRPFPYLEFGVESASYTWQDLPSASVEPDGKGGSVIRLHAPPRSLEGRIGFRAPNSTVPTGTLPKTSGSTSSSATSVVVLGAAGGCLDVGHIWINGEIMAYAGVDRGGSTTTLNNLVRGLYGTTAATHDTGSDVEWMIAADDIGLFNQLYHYTAYKLHRDFQVDGAAKERSNHQQMMLFHKGEADAFWQGYKPHRPNGKLTLGSKKFMR